VISWIQRTFQHHFRIVFGVILAVIAIPMIFIYRTGANGGSGDRQAIAQNFFGYDLGSADDRQRLFGDAQISVELQTGSGSTDDQQLQSYALRRAAALHLADEWHLPAATSGQVTAFIKSLPIFSDKTGQFDPNRYEAFRESLKLDSSLTEGDVARVISEDVRAQAVDQLLGGPGYVLPSDVKAQLVLADTTWTIAVAAVDYKSFDPRIEPTEADLQRYFQANGFRYTIPPRVVADYVSFPTAVFGKLAAKTAADFVYALYEEKVAAGAPFNAWMAAHQRVLKPLPPFSHDAVPAVLGGSAEVADAAFKLNADRYYSDALTIPGGAAVLIWKETLPASQPMFFDVRAKVLADYLDNEKRQRFVELGRALKSAIEARLRAGDRFPQAAATAAAGKVKIAVKTPAPFTLLSKPADLDSAAIGALEHLDKGRVSDMVATDQQGYIVCALDKKAPDLSETGPLYAQARARLATSIAQMDAGSVLSELVNQELKRSEPAAK
jgi:peptidyl-prolyl cis-trans isomerase D